MIVCKICKVSKSLECFHITSVTYQKAKKPKCLDCLSQKVLYTTTRLYNTWRGMKERCTNPKHKNYNLYKGKLCQDWLDFHTFRIWALANGYEEGLTIDRIDPTKGYYPINCQFLTAKENTIKGNIQRSKSYKLNIMFN